MLLKSSVLETVYTLENEVEIGELIERLIILDKVKKAESQYEKREIYTHEEVETIVAKW